MIYYLESLSKLLEAELKILKLYLSDTPAALFLVLHSGEGMVVGRDVGHDALLVGSGGVDIFGVKQFGNAKLIVGNIEGVIEIVEGLPVRQVIVVEEVRTVEVDEGIESESVPPRRAEVGYVDAGIAVRLSLCPQQQGILGGLLLRAFILFVLS